jgi:hypothetical protein
LEEMSADADCPPLGFGFNDSLGFSRQLKNRSLLTNGLFALQTGLAQSLNVIVAAHQISLNAAKFDVQMSTLENSRISRLLESNASENHGNAFFKTVFALTRSHRQEPISGSNRCSIGSSAVSRGWLEASGLNLADQRRNC